MKPRTVGDLRFVLLWSDEHRAWWRPEGMGYTQRVEEAGLYDPETVAQRWLHGGSPGVHKVRLGATPPRRRKARS